MVVVVCVLILIECGVELRNIEHGHLNKLTPKPIFEPYIES